MKKPIMKTYPLMYKTSNHGDVVTDGKNPPKILEMNVHLDMKTGNLLQNQKKIEFRGDHFEIILKSLPPTHGVLSERWKRKKE